MDIVEDQYEKAEDKKFFLDCVLVLACNPSICKTVDEFKEYFNFMNKKLLEMGV